jgi:hypothetical protein
MKRKHSNLKAEKKTMLHIENKMPAVQEGERESLHNFNFSQ